MTEEEATIMAILNKQILTLKERLYVSERALNRSEEKLFYARAQLALLQQTLHQKN